MTDETREPATEDRLKWAMVGSNLLRSAAEDESASHLRPILYAASTAIRDLVRDIEYRNAMKTLTAAADRIQAKLHPGSN